MVALGVERVTYTTQDQHITTTPHLSYYKTMVASYDYYVNCGGLGGADGQPHGTALSHVTTTM